MTAAALESAYWLHKWESFAAGFKAGSQPFAPATPAYIPDGVCPDTFAEGYLDARGRAAQLRGIHILAEVA